MTPRFSLRRMFWVMSILAIALGICISLPKGRQLPLDETKVGMSKQEVLDTIGEPDWIENEGTVIELWAYRVRDSFWDQYYISFDESGLTESVPWRE